MCSQNKRKGQSRLIFKGKRNTFNMKYTYNTNWFPHIDNCNSILFGLPEVLLSKVQHIQNSAARLITRTKRCESISPVLYNLHWLPVNKRIMFKILVITFKCIHGNSPDYIQELISLYKSSRVLRSSSKNF